MATETGPDLTGAIQAFRLLMDDTCVISRPGAKALNPATGSVVAGPGGQVYDGACLIGGPDQAQPRVVDEGGAQVDPKYAEISLPVDAPLIQAGDELTWTSSRWNPQGVGRIFRIREVVQESLLISRDLVGEER